MDKVIANLELMPLRMNIGKKDKMGVRQQAEQMRRAGLFGKCLRYLSSRTRFRTPMVWALLEVPLDLRIGILAAFAAIGFL